MRPSTLSCARLAIGGAIGILTTLEKAPSARAQDAPPPPSTPTPPPQQYPTPPPGYMPPPGYPAPFYPPPQPADFDFHLGLVVGGALGVGTFSYYGCGDVCGFGGTGELHIGTTVERDVAIELDVWVALHSFSDPRFGSGRTTSTVWTVGGQYWPTDLFWIKVGFGAGTLGTTNSSVRSALVDSTGGAFMAAAGIAIVQTHRFTVDLQLRYAFILYWGVDANPNPVAALLGVTWR